LENIKKPLLNIKHYFYRTVVFTRVGNKVALADIDHPQQTTELEDWMGIVISLADGEHTLGELVNYMASQYQQVPEKLEETLESVVERLVEGKLLRLSENKVQLPYYLAAPIEELDLEKAKKMIKDDGYTVH
jgi:hypothetical protein